MHDATLDLPRWSARARHERAHGTDVSGYPSIRYGDAMGKQAKAVGTAARRAGETMLELLGLTYVAVSLVGLVLWFTGGADLAGFWDATVLAGKGVLSEFGWVISVYVATLIAFYVLVLGEQLGHVADAGRLRRIVGSVSEAMFAALVPSVLLVAIYCVTEGSIGPLLVIVPAMALLLFLTAQLGGFVVSDVEVQLAEAEKARARSRTRLRALRSRSRRPLWLVVTVNAAAFFAVACAAAALTGALAVLTDPIVVAFALIGAITACLLASFAAALLAERTLASRVGGIAVLAIATLTVGGIVRTLQELLLTPITVAVLAMAVVAMLSAVWPLRRSPRILVDWTLAGAFTRVIGRREAKAYRESSAKIRRLKLVIAASQGSQLGRKARAVWSALKAD